MKTVVLHDWRQWWRDQLTLQYAPRAYAYQAALICPRCAGDIVDRIPAVNYADEYSYDSDEAPKAVDYFEDLTDEYCDICHAPLDT